MRYGASILALMVAVLAVQHRRWWWAWPMLAVAILWNPVVPFDLPEVVWMGAGYLGGIVFIAVGYLFRAPAGEPAG